MKLISSLLRGGRLRAAGLPALVGLRALGGLTALAALAALVGAALLAVGTAQADMHPDDLELVLSLVDDSDNIVPPGGEFTVGAELRFTSPPPAERRLRVAANSVLRLSGNLDWEDQTLHKLTLPLRRVSGGEPALTGSNAAGGGLHTYSEMIVRALDGRTLVAQAGWNRAETTDNLHIFDTWNKRQAAIIEPPAGAAAQTFGRGQGERFWNPKSLAVWQETDETAWLFVGSGWDTVGTQTLVGQLWIFRLNWAADPLEVTQVGKIAPPPSEFNNKQSGGVAAYGTGVVISSDGSTLAVSSNEINNIGAVYVYSRPDGAGEDWGDLKHADGVKVTPVATPAWGTSTTRPFTPTSTGRTGAAADCDAYCSRVSAQTGGGAGRSDILWALDLSADGSVLVVGAKGKRYPSDTPGGSFSGGNANAGEAYVFLAPNGDWRTTPEVTGTLIPALTDARQFDPEQHYSPGPARRVTEPAAVLLARPWSNPQSNANFGHEIYVSDDGTTVAVAEHGRIQVHVFQRASAAAWAGAGEVLPSATLNSGGNQAIARGGLAISGDGSQVLVGDGTHAGNIGRILIYSRPADGQWTGTFAVAAARELWAPNVRSNGRFGWPRYSLDGERLATTETAEHLDASGFFWLSDSGCTQRVVDGQRSWSCSINLGTAKVVIPPGTEASTATISGDVRISVEGVADSAVLLEDELVVRIGEVQEVDSLSFDFATNTKGTTTTADDAPHPSVLNARGEKTTLQLGILNENGKAAATGSVSSVLFTTSVGRLSTTFGEGASRGCVGGPSPSCSLNLATLDTTNAGAIPITLEHMGTVGTATIRATVVAEADGRLLETEAIEVVLAGPPAALAIAAPASGVLNVNAESTAGAEASGTDTDARDQLTLVVTAADKAGNKVELPTGLRLAWVSDADGRRVTNGVDVVWPLGGADNPRLDAAGNQRVRVNVNREATAALPNGEYTLEVRLGALRATQTFNVSGGPETVALSEPEGALRVGERFTITAQINDASGAPVPDGTRVSWQAIPLGSFSSITQVTADSRTTAGQASATYLVVSPGRTTVSAAADGKQDIRVVTVADATPPPEPPDPSELLSSQGLGPAIWLGDYAIEASGLLSALRGVGSVQMWQYGKWLRYAVAEGRVVPGSRQFTIEPNAVLWLGR